MITIMYGDVGDIVTKTCLDYPERRVILIHGCNCFNNMGAGIAKRIARLYPDAEVADKRTTHGDVHKLGSYSGAAINNCFTVANLYSQYRYGGPRGTVNVDYEAMERGFNKLVSDTAAYDTKSPVFLLPEKIGAGLAGGDVTIVRDIIERSFQGYDVILFDMLPWQ